MNKIKNLSEKNSINTFFVEVSSLYVKLLISSLRCKGEYLECSFFILDRDYTGKQNRGCMAPIFQFNIFLST